MNETEGKQIVDDCQYRQYSVDDIRLFRENLDTVIIAPYNDNQVKGVGYNLTASNMIYSLTQHKLLTIYSYKDGRYFKLKAHDTALILTYEYFQLDSKVAGNFYSRVRRVSEGLGHISTTLDPNWKGMFLIAVNNTTNRKLKVQISSIFEGQEEKNGIATVVLRGVKASEYQQHSELDGFSIDNPAMRIDILKELAYEPFRFFHRRGYNNFKQLVKELDCFQPHNTPLTNDINEIKNKLIQIRNELMYKNNISEAQSLISSLNWFDFDKNNQLKHKINALKKYLDMPPHEMYDERLKVDDLITLLKKECDYILLCEAVKQIHEIIDKHVVFHHKFGNTKQLLLKIIVNLSFILTLVSMIFLIFIFIKAFFNNNPLNTQSIYSSIAVSLITALIGLLLKRVNKIQD